MYMAEEMHNLTTLLKYPATMIIMTEWQHCTLVIRKLMKEHELFSQARSFACWAKIIQRSRGKFTKRSRKVFSEVSHFHYPQSSSHSLEMFTQKLLHHWISQKEHFQWRKSKLASKLWNLKQQCSCVKSQLRISVWKNSESKLQKLKERKYQFTMEGRGCAREQKNFL